MAVAEGLLFLHNPNDNLLVRVWFAFVTIPACHRFFGRSFIRDFLKTIFRRLRWILPQYSRPIGILPSGKGALRDFTDDAVEPKVYEAIVFSVTRNMTSVHCALVFEIPLEILAPNKLEITAKGVMGDVPNRPFYVLITNFSKIYISLTKGSGYPRFQKCPST